MNVLIKFLLHHFFHAKYFLHPLQHSVSSFRQHKQKQEEHKDPPFVYQGRSIQMGRQTCSRWTTLSPREEVTPTAGRSDRNLPPQMAMPTAWPGSTTLIWMPPGKSPQDLSGLCSPARKVWRYMATCYLRLPHDVSLHYCLLGYLSVC